jgi:hypothetical protein
MQLDPSLDEPRLRARQRTRKQLCRPDGELSMFTLVLDVDVRQVALIRVTLDSTVGRARAGCHRPRWQGANRSHGLCHGEDTQRRQRGRGQLDRVCSAVTLLVRPVVAGISRTGKY